MASVVVDVDDTLLKTSLRKRAIWGHILGREIPLEFVESHGSQRILEKFASSDEEVWERFWRVLLCYDEAGLKFLKLDDPLPYAAEVLRVWSRKLDLVYLTGRTENMRQTTLDELRAHGFPIEGADLVMAEGWEEYVASPVKVREKLFSMISERHRVQRVVDDYPGYFATYRRFSVPERIGLLRPKRYSREDYLVQGATKVVEGWQELLS